MNNADFNNQPDGFPLESDATLGFMQSTYLNGIRALAKLSGFDNIIITGLERNGNSVTEGWILKDGDLVFFEAGSYLDTYIITTNVVQKANQNGSLIDRYFIKKAMFGTGINEENFTDLFRIDNIRKIHSALAYLSRAEFGTTVWTVLDGCFPINGGTDGIGSGRVLYNGKFLEIPPYYNFNGTLRFSRIMKKSGKSVDCEILITQYYDLPHENRNSRRANIKKKSDSWSMAV